MGIGLAQICLSADRASGHRPQGRVLMRGMRQMRGRSPWRLRGKVLQSLAQDLADQPGCRYNGAVPGNNFWRRGFGRTVCRCRVVPMDVGRGDIACNDVAGSGTCLRFQGKLPAMRVYLYYEVEKTPDSTYDGRVLQSEHQVPWTRGAENVSEGTPERAEQ